MIKTNIKMRVTPEQSIKVQEICFENGIKRLWGKKEEKFAKQNRFLCISKFIIGFYKFEDKFEIVDFEEIDADLFIRTNGTCIEEKQEFTYPMWFKSKTTGDIIEFMSITKGKVVFKNPNYKRVFDIKLGDISYGWIEHTRQDNWEQVEKPKDIEDNKDNSINNGGSTDYYKLPKDTKDLQDLIEHKDMNFALGNIFKAVYRLGNCSHSDAVRDLNKIVYFANRELLRLKREKGNINGK